MAEPISVGRSEVSMMSLMPTAMPRSGPALAARRVLARQTKAPMVLSYASIASHDWRIAASAERSPDSIRRWSSASDIIGIISFGRLEFYGPDRDQASGWERIFSTRHGRARAGHPRLHFAHNQKDVDARHKACTKPGMTRRLPPTF